MIASENLAGKVRAAFDQIGQLANEWIAFCQESAEVGRRHDEVEQNLRKRVLEIGKQGMDLYLRSLGDGDLGEMVATDEGESLLRSEEPRIRPLRTVFGEHEITAYVYAPGPKQKIALAGVIFGLRQMAGKLKPKGQPRQEIEGVCRYFENNRERMRYDEYLKAGDPIAIGMIEGACRHVAGKSRRLGKKFRISTKSLRI